MQGRIPGRIASAILAAATAVLLALSPAQLQAQAPDQSSKAVAVFGSGCFWCTESDFDKIDGVLETVSGYTGGKLENPSYDMVSSGRTGHVEVVQVTYDPAKVSYEKLLQVYWHNVDPFDGKGQFCDKGSQYRPVIYTQDAAQRKLAEESKIAVAKELGQRFKFPIAVTIEPAQRFWPAEDYHQDFYKKNSGHYTRYRTGCGRDARLRTIWGAVSH